MRVLIVDDSPFDRKLLERSLRGCVECISVTGIDEAMERIGEVDLVLSDWFLGDRPNRLEELVLAARETGVPVIVISGSDASSVRAEALHAGAREFFCKPEFTDNLEALVRRLVGEYGVGK